MSTFSEQFSEVRKSQLDAQLNFFRTYTGKAFESAEKIMALNFNASRSSLEQSSALVRQMMAVKDPRDLLALTSQGQTQFDSVLAYGRQLFSIVAAPPAAVAPAPEPLLAAPPAADEPAPEPLLAAPAPAPAANEAPPAPAQASLVPDADPDAEEAPAEPDDPIAEPSPIAKAAGKSAALPKASTASFPVVSSSKPIEVSTVKPVEPTPPPAPASDTPEIAATKAADPAAKQAKKK